MAKQYSSRFIPLIISVGIVIGILLGSFFATHFAGHRLNLLNASSNKISDLLHLIDDQYVDTVDMADLVEKSLPCILRELDPHSAYISAEEVEATMEELNGSFSGIGIQFTIYEDTVRVVRVIEGGPSESVGLKAGDRIVKVGNTCITGKAYDNDKVMKVLKGTSGSKINLQVMRAGHKGLLSYTITRGSVPVKSVDAAFMLNPTTGYMRIKNFGDATYAEFLNAMARLNQHGMSSLVIDLRGNPGGYMEAAVQICNEFLPAGRLIVYTQGRRSPRRDYKSDGRGVYQSIPLVVLVDETTASAAEIMSGAMQDNDRATIIGRRTFGKGLVQVPIEFRDGSMLRLTQARYYTPSGRCVQKPYTPGDESDYEMDLIERDFSGEYYSADSIKTSGKKYKTRLGRTVYGGGGIIPDTFVPRDTLGMTSYFKEAYMRGLLNSFAYYYTDHHRARLDRMNKEQDVASYLRSHRIVDAFATFAERNGLKRRNNLIQQSYHLFETHLTSYIIADVLGVEDAARYVCHTDPAVLKALKVLTPKKRQK